MYKSYIVNKYIFTVHSPFERSVMAICNIRLDFSGALQQFCLDTLSDYIGES